MATLRARKVRKKGEVYTYWTVTYYTGTGPRARRTRSFPYTPQGKGQAELLLVEAQRHEARLKHGLDVARDGPEDVSITRWLDEFAGSIKPNCSRAYWANVLYMLRAFRAWLLARRIAGTREITRADFSAYAQHEQGRGLKPKSVGNVLQLVRRAVRWGIEEDYLDAKLDRRFPEVKAPQTHRRVLSDEEVEDILSLFQGTLLYPLVLTGIYTGIRRGEMLKATVGMVDLAEGAIRLTGEITKSGKARSVGIHDRLRPVIEEAVGGREAGEPMLLSPEGRAWLGGRVSRTFVRAVREHGYDTDLTWHCLRHTCATRLAMAGMPPFDIQRVLGHASITTTMIYVNLAGAALPDMDVVS